ncbi:MAG: glycoside hydrolase, partial [Chloroflexi bacterium]|nr:glycoside hydrolase [Chloroflexota bacterium]
MYYDLDRKGHKVRVKTVACFWPLLAELATQDQASRLVEHLSRPQEFWRPHLVPTLSADHSKYHPQGNYWQGGVWAPTTYMVIKGLENYGYYDLAQKVAENHISNMAQVYAETGTIWENYAPERARPGNIAKPDFVGWSGLGPIALLVETILGLHLDAPQNVLRWRVSHLEEHGIEHLRFGDREVNLLAHRRANLQEPVAIEVETTKGFYLEVEAGARQNRIAVTTGQHTYRLGG